MLVAGLATLLVVRTAFAHAELVGTEPVDGSVLDSAPRRVQLRFSEPIESDFFALQVYGPDRSRADRGDALISPTDPRVLETSLRELPGGTYTVVWRALSLDGHVVRGAFSFGVGAAAAAQPVLTLGLPAEGAPFPVESAVRFLMFTAAFLMLAGFAVRSLVLGDGFAALGPAAAAVEPTLLRRSLWLVAASVAVLLLVSFVGLLFQAASAAGLQLGEVFQGRAISRLLLGTRYGGMWAVRIFLLIGAIGLAAWLLAAPRGGPARLWTLGIILSAGVLLTVSASGHASAVATWTLLAIAADWVHLLAAGLWTGGLVALALVVFSTLTGVAAGERRQLLGYLARRFSWLAGPCVLILVLTGTYASWLHVPSWDALLDTAYGAALAGKLLVVLPLLGLGALNLLILGPRLRQVPKRRRGARDGLGTPRVFRAIVYGEILLATLVVAVTGILTGLPPASSALVEAKSFNETRQVGPTAVSLTIRPNQAGENRVEVALLDSAGRTAVTDVQRVRLILTMLDMEMGARELELQPMGDGRYELVGSHLSMAGQWQADVDFRRSGSDEQASFTFTVGQAPGANRPLFSPGRIALAALNARTFLALVALLGAVLLLVRPDSSRLRPRQAAMTAAGLGMIGLVVFGASVVEAYRATLPNPVPADAASVARGQVVYQANCASCHGVAGRGDGPAGFMLRPRPADFRVHLAAGHTDRQLFDWVTDGVEGTAMPAFGGQLAEQERWDVINYIKAFAER